MARFSRRHQRSKEKRKEQEARLVRRAGISTVGAFAMILAFGLALVWLAQRSEPVEHVHHRHRHGANTTPATDQNRVLGVASRQLINLANRRCPPCGQPTSGEMHVDWQGVRVLFSEPHCVTAFRNDPARVLDDEGIEWRSAVRAAARLAAAGASEREAVLAETETRWQVIQVPEHAADRLRQPRRQSTAESGRRR